MCGVRVKESRRIGDGDPSFITGPPLKGTASRRSPKQKSKSSGGSWKGGEGWWARPM